MQCLSVPSTVSPSRCPTRERFSAPGGRSEILRLPASRPRGFVAAVAFPALLLGATEVEVEEFTPSSALPDVAVDGLVADAELATLGEST